MSDFNQASALADSPDKRIRWQSCYNATKMTIPPYAIMQLQRRKKEKIGDTHPSSDTDRFICQAKRDGSLIWFVRQCDDEGESRQNPAEFMFNGPLPIPPRQIGRGTFDLPAQVLHDGSGDRLHNGSGCGPVSGKWFVLSGGGAFTCMSHDAMEAVGTGSMHTVWLTQSNGLYGFHGLTLGPGVVAAESYLSLGQEQYSNGFFRSNAGTGLIAERAGLYTFGFQATVSSGTAPRGTLLNLSVRHVPSGESEVTTPYAGSRKQEVEEDRYGYDIARGAENVAISGVLNLGAGDEVRIKNTTPYPLSLISPVLWLAKISGYKDEPPSSAGLSFGG